MSLIGCNTKQTVVSTGILIVAMILAVFSVAVGAIGLKNNSTKKNSAIALFCGIISIMCVLGSILV